MKKLNFNVSFSDIDKTGEFEGVLVKYNTSKLAHGRFRFLENSLKSNDKKKISILFQHQDYIIPIGVMSGISDEDGFKVKGKLDLSTLKNGNPVNPEAHKLYSLMKNMGVEFKLSVGGNIIERVEKEDYVEIVDFNCQEGSIVLDGAVEGAEITKVFGKDNGTKEYNKMKGNNEMEKELKGIFETFAVKLDGIEKQMLAANDEKEIIELKAKWNDLENKFSESNELVKKEFGEKFNLLNETLQKLKQDYAPSVVEFGMAKELLVMFNAAIKSNGATIEVDEGLDVKVKDAFAKLSDYEKFSTTTTSIPEAIKPTYLSKILERLQEKNPILSRINFMSISDNSLIIPREMASILPECAWVGETDARNETTGTDLDDVEIKLYQIYAMPVLSNKFLGTNFVNFLPFLMSRVEYALALKLGNTLINGNGTKKPTGILQDASVTQEITFLMQTGGADLDDGVFAKKLLSIYYSVREEIAKNSIWYLTRTFWAKISSLQNTQKDFYVTDLNTGNSRTLMGRPVEFIDSSGSGIIDFNTSVNGDYIGLFCDEANGIQAIQNLKLDMRLEDKITSKGSTKYYIEKGVGFAVQLPEYFVKIKVQKDA